MAVIGCLPQAFPESCEEADVLLGSKNKSAVISALEAFLTSGKRQTALSDFGLKDKIEPMKLSKSHEHTRAILKIEDGCDMFCSYCIIPYARGHIRSLTVDKIKEQAAALARSGHKEIVLVGINLGCYGRDLGPRLIDAVRAVCELPEVMRVRLGSLEPELLEDDDIKALAQQKKLCPHFHLSLQSGSDKTLRAMGRRYLTEDYRRLAGLIRQSFENPSITTDIMVGFPGESEEDFLESLRFVKEIGFASAHVFPYSDRVKTKAAAFPEKISAGEKKRRAQLMREVCRESEKEFLKTQVGTLQRGIFEREQNPNFHVCHTDNYTKVVIPVKNPKNKLHKRAFYVRIKEAKDNFCLGEIEDEIF